MKFAILWTPIDNVMCLNTAICSLKCFRRVLLEILPTRDRNCKHEIITILANFNRFSVEALFHKCADDRHFGPLIIVEPDLENCVESYDCQDAQSAERPKASIKTFFSV